jgi:LacI family transcriptional regulator
VARSSTGRRSSIYDVAASAGVSAKTVSRVINGEQNVSVETKARVDAAIAELGYAQNPLARSLRAGRDASVGIIVESLTDPFFGSLTSGAQGVLHDGEHAMLLASTQGVDGREQELVQAFLSRQPAGLIVVPLESDQSYLDSVAAGVPVVFVDRPATGAQRDTVVNDDEAAAYGGTQHLIAHGHRSIALIGDLERVSSAGVRERGYRRALTEAGIEVDDELVFHCGTQDEAARAALRAVEEHGVTAVFSANAKATLGIVPALLPRGHSDVALVCFGDVPMSTAVTPALTVIDQDPVELGEAAARLLMERIDGLTGAPQRVVLPTRLIQRGSGELPPRRR